MRLLVLADAPPHRPLPELVAAVAPDLVVVLGDLEPAWTDGLAEVAVRKVGVAGNHDRPGMLQGLGVEDLHLRAVEIAGLRFAGFGGSPRYSRGGPNEWTEHEAAAMLERLPPADVLLAHSPPAGANDEPEDPVHAGSPALRAWVERVGPAWVLHGHTHPVPYGRRTTIGRTRVQHVRGAAPLELPQAPGRGEEDGCRV